MPIRGLPVFLYYNCARVEMVGLEFGTAVHFGLQTPERVPGTVYWSTEYGVLGKANGCYFTVYGQACTARHKDFFY